MNREELGRAWRTVSHLRPSQVLWRMRYRLTRRRPVRIDAPALVEIRDDLPPVPHLARWDAARTLAELRSGELTLLNSTQKLKPPGCDWRLGPQRKDRLWAITLHYHQWLAEIAGEGGAADVVDLFLSDWLERCDVTAAGAMDLAWNSYAIGTRLGQWVRLAAGAKLPNRERFLQSFWRQAEFLSRNIEWDLRANHVLRDAIGLMWAGRFIRGKRARQWLKQGTQLAISQAREQVLGDGGHYELSPMYHLHAMEDVMTAALLAEDPEAAGELRTIWAAMADYLRHVTHPDRRIALLNDAAFNGAVAPMDMLEHGATALGLPVNTQRPAGGAWLSETGLIDWHGRPWTVFFDIGAIGPDEQPGHAHADTLSVECSFEGTRLFVDQGTYCYDHDADRRSDRSTAAHNTVTVDGGDSSEVWHIFRVGRRARVAQARFCQNADGFTASAAHDGYAHLPGRCWHRRSVKVDGAQMRIDDQIEGGETHRVSGGWLLGPDWRVAEQDAAGWTVEGPPGRLRIDVQGPAGLLLDHAAAEYHPEFGRRVRTRRVGWTIEGQIPLQVATIVRKV